MVGLLVLSIVFVSVICLVLFGLSFCAFFSQEEPEVSAVLLIFANMLILPIIALSISITFI